MKIINKETLAATQQTKISKIEVLAPDIAQAAKPGQFIVLIVEEKGERIPLTIVEANKDKGAITLIFQELGLSTGLLGKMKAGDFLYALAGPLGRPTEIHENTDVIIIGAGAGIAETYPVACAFKEKDSRVTTILGARSKALLILEQELKGASTDFYVTTNDGSCGKKGFVTDILKNLLAKRIGAPYSLVYAVGPLPMMRKAAEITKPFNLKTLVSLNALMVDATGMCGSCRVTVAGQVKFSCVEGPEFDAHLVDWDELIKRSSIYSEREKHICKLNNLLSRE